MRSIKLDATTDNDDKAMAMLANIGCKMIPVDETKEFKSVGGELLARAMVDTDPNVRALPLRLGFPLHCRSPPKQSWSKSGARFSWTGRLQC